MEQSKDFIKFVLTQVFGVQLDLIESYDFEDMKTILVEYLAVNPDVDLYALGKLFLKQ
jgi:hypothetical protein